MDTIFMNSENSKTSDPRKLLLNLSDKIELKSSDKHVAYQILAHTIHEKNIKKSYRKINFGSKVKKRLIYQMDYILYQIFKTIFNIP